MLNTSIKPIQNDLLGTSVACEVLGAVVMVMVNISIKPIQNDLLGTSVICEVLAALPV